MGGAAPTPSGKGGKKPLDAAINLVPFIDLLSCCISFLLKMRDHLNREPSLHGDGPSIVVRLCAANVSPAGKRVH